MKRTSSDYFFQHFPANILLIDPKGDIIDCNIKMNELLEKNNVKDIHNLSMFIEDFDSIDEFLDKLNSGKTVPIRYSFNGIVKTWDTNIKLHEDQILITLKDNVSSGSYFTIIFNELIENFEDPIFMFDMEDRYIYVNKAYCIFHEIIKDDILGKHISETYSGEVLNQFIQEHKKVKDTGQVHYNESIVTNKDGKEITSHTSVWAVKNYNNEIVGVIGIAKNISKQRLLERQQKEQTQNLELMSAIFLNAPDSLFFIDTSKIYRYVNQTYADIHTTNIEDIIGKANRDLFSEEIAQKFDKINDEVLRERKEIAYETDVMILGKRVISSSIKRPFYDSDGDLKGIIGVSRDITQMKKLELKLVESQRIESLATLAGGFAHDFNNLLSGILGNTELLLRREDTEKKRKYLSNIINITDRAAKITAKLLEIGKQGRNIIVSVNLNEVITEVISVVKHSRFKNINFLTNLEPHLHTVDGDPGQLFQLIMNITINGMEAMEKGGQLELMSKNVVLKDGNNLSLTPGSYVYLEICDEGIGMDKDTILKIFDPFFTTKSKKNVSGTGLGLFSAYSVVKDHRGIIEVESDLYQGSTFKICLPKGIKTLEREIQEDKPIKKGRGTILVIDDNEELLKIINSFLQQIGYTVLLSESGKKGIEMYKENYSSIDLVLLDYIMPEMNGLEVFQKLKSINTEVRVLLVTGYSKEEGIMEMEDNGINGIVSKPFNLNNLAIKISEILKNKF